MEGGRGQSSVIYLTPFKLVPELIYTHIENIQYFDTHYTNKKKDFFLHIIFKGIFSRKTALWYLKSKMPVALMISMTE